MNNVPNELFENILPIDLRKYAETIGWMFNVTSRNAYIASNPQHMKRMLHFPSTNEAPDYLECIGIEIWKIADMERKSIEAIIAEIHKLKSE